MVLPPQDALALINEELSQIQDGVLPLSPPHAEAPVPSSTALAAPATSVDIDIEFDELLTELEEDEAADMDVDSTGTTAQGRTQVRSIFLA